MSSATKVDSCLRMAERVGLEAAASGSNFIFSPLSIRAALALAAAGAGGETLAQMLTFLGSPTVDHLNSAAARFLTPFRSNHGGGTGPRFLSFVNGVWVDASFTLKTPFREVAANVYGAIAKSVDFKHQASEVVKEVNDWVHEETNGFINDLIPSDAVNESTSLILANAVYFRGLWAENFDASLTREATFHLLDNTTVQVFFMIGNEYQIFSSFDGFKVLKLYYQQKKGQARFYMLIFLPDKNDGLTEVMHKISSDPDFIRRHTPRERIRLGNFMIPKFKISHGFEASEVLKDLGMRTPFDGQQADFTEMASPWADLFISSVYHKANVEVDEEGTVASAATAVGFELKSLPEDFVADHPFVFAIIEEGRGSLLFLGHVVRPEQEQKSIPKEQSRMVSSQNCNCRVL